MTKTMQPVLPSPYSLEATSPAWWYTMRQETNSLIDAMIARRGPMKRISIDFQDNELTMNEQHDWDCHHASSHVEAFDNLIGDDFVEEIYISVCNECNRWYDERINEWRDD